MDLLKKFLVEHRDLIETYDVGPADRLRLKTALEARKRKAKIVLFTKLGLSLAASVLLFILGYGLLFTSSKPEHVSDQKSVYRTPPIDSSAVVFRPKAKLPKPKIMSTGAAKRRPKLSQKTKVADTIDRFIIAGINNSLLAKNKELQQSFLNEFRRLDTKAKGDLKTQQKIYLLRQINEQVMKLELFANQNYPNS